MAKPKTAGPATGRRVKQVCLWCGVICIVAAAISANVQHLQVQIPESRGKGNTS